MEAILHWYQEWSNPPYSTTFLSKHCCNSWRNLPIGPFMLEKTIRRKSLSWDEVRSTEMEDTVINTRDWPFRAVKSRGSRVEHARTRGHACRPQGLRPSAAGAVDESAGCWGWGWDNIRKSWNKQSYIKIKSSLCQDKIELIHLDKDEC